MKSLANFKGCLGHTQVHGCLESMIIILLSLQTFMERAGSKEEEEEERWLKERVVALDVEAIDVPGQAKASSR